MNWSVVIFSVVCIGIVHSQDVPIPDDILDISNTTAFSDVNQTTRPLNSSQNQDLPRPREIRNTTPIPPCSESETIVRPTVINPGLDIVRPISRDIIDPFERDVKSVCPIGTHQQAGRCVSSSKLECRAPYTLENERCVLSRTECPINFLWNGRSCVEQHLCPANSVWQVDRCVLNEPQCQSGWVWNGEKCKIINRKCPQGSVLQDNLCIHEKVTCPTGYYDDGFICRQTLTCPQGYLLDSDTRFCIKETVWCPAGSQLIDGFCKRTISDCPKGTYLASDGLCYYHSIDRSTTSTTRATRTTTTTRSTTTRRTSTELAPPSEIGCTDGSFFYRGECYMCPEGTVFDGHYCRKSSPCKTPTSTGCCGTCNGGGGGDGTGDININIKNDNPAPPSQPQSFNILNHFEPINNAINNINNITHPVTLNNYNVNNINVFSDTQCSDGSIRTTITRNNETINGCANVTGSGENVHPTKKCCEVSTPRQCKKREGRWMCAHKRYKYCGEFCVADQVFLRPPRTTFVNQILTTRPQDIQTQPCQGMNCPPVDCTGCYNGSYDCSSECFTYPCHNSGCSFLEQEDFCETVGGTICE